jgi:two-component system, NarL family, response regulator NreC
VCPHAHLERGKTHGEKKIRCVLAHDYVLLRQGLRRLLEDEPDVDVVGEAGNAADGLSIVGTLTPDVVITDAGTFGCAAEQAEQMILQESPRSAVLFVTGREEDEHDSGSRRATRQTSAEELIEMLREMGAAELAVVREMPRRGGEESATEKVRSRRRGLTAREREVLELLAAGRTVRAAAKMLGLSVKTVDAHKFNLMRKLGIHNKAELVMWAIQKRIVKLPANF